MPRIQILVLILGVVIFVFSGQAISGEIQNFSSYFYGGPIVGLLDLGQFNDLSKEKELADLSNPFGFALAAGMEWRKDAHLFVLEDRLTWLTAQEYQGDFHAGLNKIQMCILGGYGYRLSWFSPRIHLGLGGGRWDYMLIESTNARQVQRKFLALSPGIEFRANLTSQFFLNAIGGYEYTLGLADYQTSGKWLKSDYEDLNFNSAILGLNIGGSF